MLATLDTVDKSAKWQTTRTGRERADAHGVADQFNFPLPRYKLKEDKMATSNVLAASKEEKKRLISGYNSQRQAEGTDAPVTLDQPSISESDTQSGTRKRFSAKRRARTLAESQKGQWGAEWELDPPDDSARERTAQGAFARL